MFQIKDNAHRFDCNFDLAKSTINMCGKTDGFYNYEKIVRTSPLSTSIISNSLLALDRFDINSPPLNNFKISAAAFRTTQK